METKLANKAFFPCLWGPCDLTRCRTGTENTCTCLVLSGESSEGLIFAESRVKSLVPICPKCQQFSFSVDRPQPLSRPENSLPQQGFARQRNAARRVKPGGNAPAGQGGANALCSSQWRPKPLEKGQTSSPQWQFFPPRRGSPLPGCYCLVYGVTDRCRR